MNPQKFVLKSDETWQFRTAQSVRPEVANAIRHVCESNKLILACYVLEARQSEASDVKLVIAPLLAEKANEIDQVVIQFQEMLRQFPSVAENTCIMSGEQFKNGFAGKEFYARNKLK